MKIDFKLFLLIIPFLIIVDAPSYGQINNLKKGASTIPGSKKLGTGPRYWMAYEYCWMNDKPIPENLWKENIDWVSDNFRQYGYDMVSTDGWIEAAQTINENGFITKYNSNWQNGFKYWANYVNKKGMKLGVYYNPLWLTKAAFENNTTVIGTNVHTKDIAGKTSFNDELHWVDVSKPGAKEWVQGYIRYFKSMGVNFLRIDFLENYENNYGTGKYDTALRWMKEAADSTMFLSLVMPNCFQHAKTELKYGDMIRISDDCFNGGWDFLSNRKRGLTKPNWPQHANAFDGFINFADLSGRNKMILDGDFIRLNTLNSEKEKKFQISLYTMAGSPITIADQFNTIGNNAWLYQNRELLYLNDIGFVGKPLSYDIHDKQNSNRWAGQLPDGSWVVALFNREDSLQNLKIDFVKELGLQRNEKYAIRDLWEHKELGNISNTFSVILAPHDSRIIKITNTSLKKHEAEFASILNGAQQCNAKNNNSGLGYVELHKTGASVLFAIQVSKTGLYTLLSTCKNVSQKKGTASLYVNGTIRKKLMVANTKKWTLIPATINLCAGINYIEIKIDAKNTVPVLIDNIKIQ